MAVLATNLAVANDSIAPGVTHRTLECFGAHELTVSANKTKGLEFRILRNETAHESDHCSDGYGGKDADALFRKPDRFEVLAATNGAVFRVLSPRNGTAKFRANSFLWSGKTLAPVSRHGGTRFVVIGETGAKEVESEPTESSAKRILRENPRAQAILQLRSPLHKPSWFSCTPERAAQTRTHWACKESERTLLCIKPDRSFSLIVTDPVLVSVAADGFLAGGPCGTQCVKLYNLDGGGSTQMGLKMGKGAYKTIFGRTRNEAGCSRYRPVDHMLAIGRPGK